MTGGEEQFVFVPEEHTGERWIALLVFVVTCAYLLLFRRYTALDPDEGIILQGAQRILQGEVLYRDFFSFLTPGSFYFLAFFLKVFGDTFLVARTVFVFVGGVCSLVTYLLARRVCSRWSALLTAGIVSLTTLPFRFMVLHNWDSTLWACLALYCGVRLLESRGPIWAFGAGSFASLTLLFEQSKGAGLLLGLVGGGLAITWMDRKKPVLNRVGLAGLSLGILWPLLVVLAYFAAMHSVPEMLADWLWPLRHYSTANRVMYGSQNWSDSTRQMLFGGSSWTERIITIVTLSPSFLIPAFPILAVALLLYWIVRTRRQASLTALGSHYILITATLSGLLLSVIAVRADIIHFMYLQPLFALVLAWIMDGRDIPGRIFRAVRPALVLCLAISFVAFSMAMLVRNVGARYRVETRRGTVTLPAVDTVIEYVQARVAPDERILVYPYLPLYYYLTATASAAPYDYFQPGMHTREQAREIVAALDSQRVRVVLYEIAFTDKIPTSWPGTPVTAMVNDPVSNYVFAHYRSCAVLKSPMNWRFLFMIRKELACP